MRGIREIDTASEDETVRLGVMIGRVLRPGDVILLTGNLGSGKTRLAKGLVSGATGVDPDEVVSPTFTLINRFDGEFPVFHADLYRLEGSAIDQIGLDDALEDEGALIVEWPERKEWLEPDPLTVSLAFGKEETVRRISLRWSQDSAWGDRLEQCMETGAFDG